MLVDPLRAPWRASEAEQRHRRKLVAAALLALLASLAKPVVARADEDRLKAYGKHLSAECSACHRLDGLDNGIPSIAGLPTDVFIATIGFYKNGSRTNPTMVSVAQSLDDEQVRALAAYYGTLARRPPRAPTKGK